MEALDIKNIRPITTPEETWEFFKTCPTIEKCYQTLRCMFATTNYSERKNLGENILNKILAEFDPTKPMPKEWWCSVGITDRYFDFDTLAIPSMHMFEFRFKWAELFSWAIPSLETCESIVNFFGETTVKEYMAGTGYWSYLLRKMGLDIQPSDFQDGFPCGESPTFLNVDIKDVCLARVGDSYLSPDDGVFMSWIPYGFDGCLDMMKSMVPGQKLVVIGENDGGCNQAEEVWEYMQENFDSEIESVCSFYGIHDFLWMGIKKSRKRIVSTESESS